jgi:hypothetical protein
MSLSWRGDASITSVVDEGIICRHLSGYLRRLRGNSGPCIVPDNRIPLHAHPSPVWTSAATFGGGGSDIGQAVEVDRDGNRYVTGSFSTTAYFPVRAGAQMVGGDRAAQPASARKALMSAGGTDISLAKYDRSGGQLFSSSFGFWRMSGGRTRLRHCSREPPYAVGTSPKQQKHTLPMRLKLATGAWAQPLCVPTSIECQIAEDQSLLAFECRDDFVGSERGGESRSQSFRILRGRPGCPQDVVRSEQGNNGVDILAAKGLGPRSVEIIDSWI